MFITWHAEWIVCIQQIIKCLNAKKIAWANFINVQWLKRNQWWNAMGLQLVVVSQALHNQWRVAYLSRAGRLSLVGKLVISLPRGSDQDPTSQDKPDPWFFLHRIWIRIQNSLSFCIHFFLVNNFWNSFCSLLRLWFGYWNQILHFSNCHSALDVLTCTKADASID